MSVLNPYAGWSNASSGAIPSIQGALPYLTGFTGRTEAKWVSFRFTSMGEADPLNCQVLDHSNQTRFSISTIRQPNGVPVTTMYDANGSAGARIEWLPQPTIELQTYSNQIPRQFVSQFLGRSSDGMTKSMVLKGKTYQWSLVPQEGVIRWSNASYSPSEQLGALFKTQSGGVVLAVAPTAISEGLLDVAVLTAVLFAAGPSNA